jgi:hypothetical protein
MIVCELSMEEERYLKNLYRERRLVCKEILRYKRLRSRVIPEKISIRRGCKEYTFFYLFGYVMDCRFMCDICMFL